MNFLTTQGIYFLNRHKEALVASGLAAGVANPTTRKAGLVATGWTIRKVVFPAAYHSSLAASIPAINLGKVVGKYVAAPVATGATIGAAVGLGAGYAIGGKSGFENALDLYTGQVSVQEFGSAVDSIARHYIPDLSGYLPWN